MNNPMFSVALVAKTLFAKDYFFIIANIVLSILCIYIIVMSVRKNKSHKVVDSDRDIMFLSAAEINVLVNSVNSVPRGIVSTILDLYRRDYISIRHYTRPSKQNEEEIVNEYEFTLLKSDNELTPSEHYFLDYLFNGEDIVNTEQILRKMKTEESFTTNQGRWFDLVQSDLASRGFFDDKYKEQAKKFFVIGGIVLVFGLATIASKYIIGLATIFTSLGLVLVGLNNLLVKSDEGMMQFNYWNGFMNSIEQNQLDDYDLNDERYIVYAIALGLPMEKLTPLFEKAKSSGDDMSFLDVFMILNEQGGSVFDDKILKSFMDFSNTTTKEAIDTTQAAWRIFKN